MSPHKLKGTGSVSFETAGKISPFFKPPNRRKPIGIAAEDIPKSQRFVVLVDGLVFRSGSNAFKRHMRWHGVGRKKCDCLRKEI